MADKKDGSPNDAWKKPVYKGREGDSSNRSGSVGGNPTPPKRPQPPKGATPPKKD